MTYELRRRFWAAALILAFFVLWEILCIALQVSDLVVPRPSQVFQTLVERFPILVPHIIQTLWTTMVGFVLGVAVGVAIGAAIGVSRVAYDTAYPVDRFFVDPQGSGCANLRSVVRLRLRAGNSHCARHVLLPDRR